MTPRWGVLWRSNSKLDGKREHLMCENRMPMLFITRKEAREWIERKYGYIKRREDLRSEPHGWKMPIPVRVAFSVVSK